MEKLSKKDFYEVLDEETSEYDATKETHNMDERQSSTDHPHDFSVRAGNLAHCECGWGVYLDKDDTVKEGHIYRFGELIV